MATNKRGSSNSRRLILLLLTSGFFITGLLFDYMPMIVDNQIKRTVELATQQEIQSIWSRPPVDFHSYYWLYEVLNADKFMAGEEKVRVRRVGPYHYVSRWEKKILEISQNKYRITYNTTRHFTADEVNSVSLDEPLVLLNPIYATLMAGAREMTRDQDLQGKQMMMTSLSKLADKFNETLFVNTTARLALNGRRLPIVEKLVKMAETFGMDMELPDVARSKLFGYVAIMNGTWDGPYEIYSGYQASMNSLGDIISYQGKKRLTEFQGKCNRLQASAGELRPMPVHENQTLEIFQPRFCRIMHLNPTGTRKLKEGLAVSYELSPDDFLSGQTNPDNRCYCLNKTLNSYCSLSGALELGPCSYYSPIVVTASNIRPDERITNSVMNWDPDMLKGDIELVPKADDRGQILVLKRLGVPAQADITLTLLMKVIRDPAFRQTSQVPEESYIPVLTVRERGQIPPKLGQIIVNLESFLGLTTHLKVVMYLTAVVLLCWLTGHYYTKSSAQSGGGNPRISPSTEGDDRASQQSELTKEGQQQQQQQHHGQGQGQRQQAGGGRSLRGSRVAMPASGAPSDRANSADSSRSQPPSRVSHSSLDVGSADEPVAPGEAADAGQQSGPDTANKQHRIFSKVDEEAALKSESWRAKRQANFHSKKQTDTSAAAAAAAAANGRRADSSSSSVSSSVAAAAAAAVAAVGSAGLVGDADEDADGLEEDRRASAAANRRPANKRNWFMKVCSNFVRMLNGIRSSINDAGQLDINENDYQDKQLEMLAGKIDSWYQSSPVTPDLSSSTNSTSGAGSNSTDQQLQRQHQQSASNLGAEMAEQQSKELAEQKPSGGGLEKRENDTGQTSKKDEDDDAGIGSESEETTSGKAHRSSLGQAASIPTLVTTRADSSDVAGSKAETPIDEGVKPDAAKELTALGQNSKGANVSTGTTASTTTTMGDKNPASEEEMSLVDAAAESNEEKDQPEVGQSMEETRRDSIQSNATVINRGDDSADSGSARRQMADEQSKSEQQQQQLKRQPSSSSANNNKNLGSQTTAGLASAAGEPNNELAARDKTAALESMERALSAATTNRIEGY